MQEARRDDYLSAMGITSWQRREVAADELTPESVGSEDTGGEESLQSLAVRVAGCRLCKLNESRQKTVFGAGSDQPRLMIIGEAPSAEEDACGDSFVGTSGQLLDYILRAMGLNREQIFVSNIVKCHPAGNKKPGVESLHACREHLDRQIALLNPPLLLALGAVSAQSLLGIDTPVARLRGIEHAYGEQGIPLYVTYHPAYLLRKPQEKAKVWTDLQMVMERL